VDRQFNFPPTRYVTQSKLNLERILIDRFQDPLPELSLHLDRRPDDRTRPWASLPPRLAVSSLPLLIFHLRSSAASAASAGKKSGIFTYHHRKIL
jgi:hypothetical protein